VVFPREKQASLVVFRESGSETAAKVNPPSPGQDDSFSRELRKRGHVQVSKSDEEVWACLYRGEELSLSSEKFTWTLIVEEIANPGGWRTGIDLSKVRVVCKPR